MAGYLASQIFQRVITLVVIALITFLLMNAVPGGPFEVIGGMGTSDELIASQEAFYGLDDSMPEQFGRWMGNLVQGDLGISFAQGGRGVNDVLRDGIKASAILGAMTFLLVASSAVKLRIGGVLLRWRSIPSAGA